MLLLSLFVPPVLGSSAEVGERGVFFATICAAVFQLKNAKIIWMECFVRFTDFVGQSGSSVLA